MCSTQCEKIPECCSGNSILSGKNSLYPAPKGQVGDRRRCVFKSLFNKAMKMMCLSTGKRLF